MKTLWTTSLLLACFCLGCQKADSVSMADIDSESNDSQDATSEENRSHGEDDASRDSDQQEREDIVVSKDDLTERLEMFPDEINWTCGERSPGELAGSWVSQDADQEVIIFHADGTFSEDFNGNMTTGFFMISESGRIATLSSWKDVQLGSHFQFDGKTIVGPKGPLPNVEWKRLEGDSN